MDKPYRALVKLIMVIESCETVEHYNSAVKMWTNLNVTVCNYNMYDEIESIILKKKNKLQEKENANS
ncbi:MAG: hypothetical protein WC055_00600 [Melioribacteraceae bacterium]